jgi:hypothetical protein
MAFFGDKDKPVGDKLASGAMLGAVAGIGSGAIYAASKKTGRLGWYGGGKYVSSMNAKYRGFTADIVKGGKTYSGMKALPAAFHAYGTRGVFTGLGAVIGATVAGEGHRTEGAAIGAGVGFAARTVIGGTMAYKQWGKVPGGKSLFIAGLSALAFVGSSAFANHDHVTTASYNAGADGGYDAYDPGSAPDSGVRERAKNIGATGDVVMGSHRARHG